MIGEVLILWCALSVLGAAAWAELKAPERAMQAAMDRLEGDRKVGQ